MARSVNRYDGLGLNEAQIKALTEKDKRDKAKGNVVSAVNQMHDANGEPSRVVDMLNEYATIKGMTGRFSYTDNGAKGQAKK